MTEWRTTAAVSVFLLAAGWWLAAWRAVPVLAADLEETFHHTYALAADGRVSLENVNGDVHDTSWTQNEVRVEAIKRASSQDRL